MTFKKTHMPMCVTSFKKTVTKFKLKYEKIYVFLGSKSSYDQYYPGSAGFVYYQY